MNRYKTIIWDLDGTLMDTLKDLMLAVNYALRVNGMPERTIDEVRQFVGNGVRRLVERSVPESIRQGMSTPDSRESILFDKVFTDFKGYYVQHCQDNSGLYAGMHATLQALKERGVRMAVVSNKLQKGVTELCESKVKTLDTGEMICMMDYMDVAIGERPEVARKPAPDMVYKALEEMGIDKEGVVYVGDSDVDIATARNAGLPCISVLWGFRDKEFLIEHGATTCIEAPQDILEYVYQ